MRGPNSTIKHVGQARVPKKTKGQKPGGAWNETRGTGKVNSTWGRLLKLAIKGTSVLRVQLSGFWRREIEHLGLPGIVTSSRSGHQAMFSLLNIYMKLRNISNAFQIT